MLRRAARGPSPPSRCITAAGDAAGPSAGAASTTLAIIAGRTPVPSRTNAAATRGLKGWRGDLLLRWLPQASSREEGRNKRALPVATGSAGALPTPGGWRRQQQLPPSARTPRRAEGSQPTAAAAGSATACYVVASRTAVTVAAGTAAADFYALSTHDVAGARERALEHEVQGGQPVTGARLRHLRTQLWDPALPPPL